MKNVGHYGCLIKKYRQWKLSTMTRNTFNIRRGGDVSFYYKSIPI